MADRTPPNEDATTEPVPDVHTVAEPGQPPESDDSMTVILEPPSDIRPALTKYRSEMPAVLTEPENESAVNGESSSVAANVDTSEDIDKKARKGDFAQTFFKYMKNPSDKRFVEIVNQEVDHEDENLIFYRSSSQLLRSFQGTNAK